MEETRYHHKHHEHYSKRAGRNRTTKSQKRRKVIETILFNFLCIIAALIIAIIVYDEFYGLF